MNKSSLIVVSSLSLLLANLVYAETVNVPASANPGRILRDMQHRYPEQRLPKAPPGQPTLPPTAQGPLGPEAKKIFFVLKEVTIEGAHVFSEKQLSTLYKDKLTKKISVAELQTIVDSVTNYYHDRGYILSQAVLVPQKIESGMVRIQVIEGYIDHVNVVGDPGRAKSLIQAYGNRILKSKPLQNSVLERYLMLANDISGVNVKAVFEPSKTTPGASDLTLVAEMKPVTASLAYDNYNTRYTGPHEALTTLVLNSGIRAGDKTSLVYTRTSTLKQLYTFDLTHDTPLGTDGMKLSLNSVFTETVSGYTLKPSDSVGRTKSASATIKDPVIRSRDKNLTLQESFNYTDSQSNLLGGLLSIDHIRAVKFGGTFSNNDSWKGSNSITITGTEGLNAFGATRAGATFVTRQGAASNYMKLTANGSRTQQLGGRFSLLGVFSGQYSGYPLLTSEQFSFGGSSLGRGYDNSEILGDRGIAGSIDLRMDTYPGLPILQYTQLYTFYDIGKVWSRSISHVGTKASSSSAASTGIGMQIVINKYISGNAFIAEPLTRRLASAQARNLTGAGPRFLFSVTVST